MDTPKPSPTAVPIVGAGPTAADSFCSMPDCARDAWSGLHLGVQVGCFCSQHFANFEASPEGRRAARAAGGQTNWRQVLVSALSDFRTRVEAEQRNGSAP